MTDYVLQSVAEIEHERRNGVAWAAFGEARAKATRLVGAESIAAHQVAREALQAAYDAARLECSRDESCRLCGRRK